MIAVALLDGELMPAQYTAERIAKDDVQRLLRRVIIRPNPSFTERFPREMPVRLAVTLLDGRRFEMEQSDYEGFHSRPLPWEGAVAKFDRLSSPHCGRQSRDAIVDAVRDIESTKVPALTRLLSALHAGDRDMNHERAFSFIPLNAREAKPRRRGITEIRGPYYSVMGERYLTDVLETMGWYVDGLKFAGGSFALMPRQKVKAIIDLAHAHDVYVSTGGWMEHVLTRGREAVESYIRGCAELGFDVVELSTGFISLPADDLIRLVKKVVEAGLKAKPELGIQFGAGGDTPAEALQAEGTRDVRWVIDQAKRCLDAGASIIMIESEGITENVVSWRTDAVARIINAVGLEKTMFEAADAPVFEWYVKNYGVHVNLFVDHSQIVQLECLRSGIWGTKSTWGRVLAFGD
jgi:phosphosulfolactate synthase (CoM biosynthesis protein A)